MANAIEREGEELRGLHSQLNDLLKESKERAKEDEVKNILSITWNPPQVVAMLLSLQVQLDATLHTIDMFCQLIAQVGPVSKGEFGHSCWIFSLPIHLSCHLSQHHKHNFHHHSSTSTSRFVEVLDQADEGFPSRLLFSSDHLTDALLRLNDG